MEEKKKKPQTKSATKSKDKNTFFGKIKINYDSFFKFSLFLFVLIIVIASIILNNSSPNKVIVVNNNSDIVMYFFYLNTCPHCRAQEKFHSTLLKEFPNLKIIKYEMTSEEGRQKYYELSKKLNLSLDKIATPTTIIGNQVNIGFLNSETTGKKIEQMIKKQIQINKEKETSLKCQTTK